MFLGSRYIIDMIKAKSEDEDEKPCDDPVVQDLMQKHSLIFGFVPSQRQVIKNKLQKLKNYDGKKTTI
jgi:hypothetical protein